MTRFLNTQSHDFDENWHALLNATRGNTSSQIVAETTKIVENVRKYGAKAVAELTLKFDQLTIHPNSLQAQNLQLEKLAQLCPPHLREALDFAASRISAFHQKQKPDNLLYTEINGSQMGWKWNPIDSAALYVPGGRASYPSSVLMNAIPARIAGVKRLVMTSPAPHGKLNPAIAYAAMINNIQEFYPIGGAQAIAALAFGAGKLEPVRKIAGPGNAYVAAAKKIVFGHTGIDSIAGPSEICIVADNNNNPKWIASDLLAQAEHDPEAQSILITPNHKLASDTNNELTEILETLPSRNVAEPSWKNHGAIIISPLELIPELVNQLAPEHLQLAVDNPENIARNIHNAGAIFLGHHSPEVFGDYLSGPNHVLPTSRTSRFSSGLSVPDFCTRTTLQKISAAACRELAETAAILAEAEGLPAHAMSARLRLENNT